MAEERKKKNVNKEKGHSKNKSKNGSSNQKKTSQKNTIKSTASLPIRKKASSHSSQEKLERTLMLQQLSVNSMTDAKTKAKEKAKEKSRKANGAGKVTKKSGHAAVGKTSSEKKNTVKNGKSESKLDLKSYSNKAVVEKCRSRHNQNTSDVMKKNPVFHLKLQEDKKTSFFGMKKLGLAIAIICVVVLLGEGIYFLLWKADAKAALYYDSLNALVFDNTDIVVVGSSNFENSEYHEDVNGIEKAKLIKYDQYGSVLFEKMYLEGIHSTFHSVITVEDGYIVVGSYEKDQSQKAAQVRDALIVKYDKEGNMIWRRTFSSLDNSSFTKVIEAGGGYVVVGQSIYADRDFGTSADGGGVILKYSKDGELLWKTFHGGTKSAIFHSVVEVNGDFYVVGKDGIDFGILVKISGDGKYQWHKNYRYTDSFGFSDISYIDGKLYVIGAKKIFEQEVTDESNRDTDNTNGLLVCYGLDGEIQFEKTFGGSKQERYKAMIEYRNTLFVVGITNSTDSGLKIFTDGNSMTGILIKYDLDGNIERKNVFGGSNQDVLTDVITDHSNLYITAYTNSKDGNIITSRDNGRDYFGRLIKVDSKIRTLFLK